MGVDESVDAFIALGANLGDRGKNIREAIRALQATPDVTLVRVSSLLENPAVGGPEDSPAFLNAAAHVRTSIGAEALLQRLLQIEQGLGRMRREKWGPRKIDLDLLLYGREIIDQPELKVPHPLLHERRFVLQPLAEIAPGALHPVRHATIRELLDRLDALSS